MKDKEISILKMIADDMEKDAKNFDGQPFTGEVVGECLGRLGGAITILANIIREGLESKSGKL